MSLTKFYKKLTLANFINWFAVRTLRVVKVICARLLMIAIRLDPDRQIFRDNLKSLGYNINSPTFFPFTKNTKYPYYGFIKGCKLLGQKITILEEKKFVDVNLPIVINSDFKISKSYQCRMELPQPYVAELKNAQVFGSTDLVMVNDTVLYDEINESNIKQYAIKAPVIKNINTSNVTIISQKFGKNIIDKAIHLLKDHSHNYFHWIVENLPRLSLVKTIDKSIPLIIDERLPKQFHDALELFNTEKRKIIYIKSGVVYRVNKLIYPSPLTIIHDNYGIPVFSKDSIYNVLGLDEFSKQILKSVNPLQIRTLTRRIFVSRKNSDYRQLINSKALEELLITRGFEIIFPENMSFIAQVNLFSQAEIIIGQSGAGMANCIFANKNCRIIMLVSNAPSTNLHLFGSLCNGLNLKLEYLIGKTTKLYKKYSIHSDFYIDIELLMDHLDKIGIK